MTFFCSAGIKERGRKANFATTWRRWRDLTPRAAFTAYRISSADPSATWVHLQLYCDLYYAIFFAALQVPVAILPQTAYNIHSADGVEEERHENGHSYSGTEDVL